MTPTRSPGETSRRLIPAAVAGLLFAAMAGLYLGTDRLLYVRLIDHWGFRAFIPPFLDIDTVLSALRCVRIGVDVFVTNPCDQLGRVYDYSPLWLVAAAFPVTTGWVAPVGIAVDLAFFLSLLLLPGGRGWWQTALITFGVISTASVYAVERANNDLVVFELAAGATALAARNRSLRLLGYCLAFLSGLLKYYPMTVMALAARERPRMFLLVTAAALGGLAVFVALDRADIARALALIPSGSPFGDMFGAGNLGAGFAELLDWPVAAKVSVEIILIAAALVTGVSAGAGAEMKADLETLTEAERLFLMTGALLILGCFLTAQNLPYRATHLLMLLPGLTALATLSSRRSVWRICTAMTLLLLWSQGLRQWLDASVAATSPLHLAEWLTREMAWWWVTTVLVALLFALLRRSEMGVWIEAAWLRRRTVTGSA